MQFKRFKREKGGNISTAVAAAQQVPNSPDNLENL